MTYGLIENQSILCGSDHVFRRIAERFCPEGGRVGIPMDTPIAQAERVVSAGKGIGSKENMKLIEDLARNVEYGVHTLPPFR